MQGMLERGKAQSSSGDCAVHAGDCGREWRIPIQERLR
jgi:hypothetical protein